MCALAVFFEREGLSTVVVALTRLHAEIIEAPRALWVPFELGRPLGGNFNAGGFPKRVLHRALMLLEHKSGPVLEDFQSEDPAADDDPDWTPPDLQGAANVQQEIELLRPHWEKAKERFSHTLVGLSGFDIPQAANFVCRFDTDNPAPNPQGDQSDLLRLRFSADDLRTFYAEASMATGQPSSQQIAQWFYGQSKTAAHLHRIRNANIDHPTASRSAVCGRMLIPGRWLHIEPQSL